MPEFVALLLPFVIIAGIVAAAAVLIAAWKRPMSENRHPDPRQSELSKRMMTFYMYVGAAALVVFVVSYVISRQ